MPEIRRKAGNINHALKFIQAPLLVVFDANIFFKLFATFGALFCPK